MTVLVTLCRNICQKCFSVHSFEGSCTVLQCLLYLLWMIVYPHILRVCGVLCVCSAVSTGMSRARFSFFRLRRRGILVVFTSSTRSEYSTEHPPSCSSDFSPRHVQREAGATPSTSSYANQMGSLVEAPSRAMW